MDGRQLESRCSQATAQTRRAQAWRTSPTTTQLDDERTTGGRVQGEVTEVCSRADAGDHEEGFVRRSLRVAPGRSQPAGNKIFPHVTVSVIVTITVTADADRHVHRRVQARRQEHGPVEATLAHVGHPRAASHATRLQPLPAVRMALRSRAAIPRSASTEPRTTATVTSTNRNLAESPGRPCRLTYWLRLR